MQSLLVALACWGCSSDTTDANANVPTFGGADTTSPAAPAMGGAAVNTDPANPAPATSGTPTTVSEPTVAPDLNLKTPESNAGGGEQNPSAMGGGAADPGSEPGAAGAGGAAPGGEMPSGGNGTSASRPSAMCGKGGASPSFNLPNTLFSVPDRYDGTTPLPVVIAFHAAGNPNTQLRGILGGTLQGDYIVFYPKSDGNGWVNGVDTPKVDAIFAALDATACYDQNRVFATGHSSGAQFVVQRLCAGESRWRAVATVASSVYCSAWQPIPALVIHGIGDTERQAYGLNDGDGLKDIVPYRTSNGCQDSYTDVAVDGCTSGGVQVNPGCRDFNGCSERTRWCQHNDPQYGTSHHGVPCFGARVIKDFFDSYQ